MSVKFEQKETIRTNLGTPGKQDLAHEVGNALTRGGGANGYLAVSRHQRYATTRGPAKMHF